MRPEEREELESLRRQIADLLEENAGLRARLGIEASSTGLRPDRSVADPPVVTPSAALPLGTEPIVNASSSAQDKIALFSSLFCGRSDVYARRWESASGKSGYAPACANEWRRGLCDKRATKCADCANRDLLNLDDQAIEDHLTGRAVLGAYAMLKDESCRFLAIDLDGVGWRESVSAIRLAAWETRVPVAVEISRSGNGAHLWVFFVEPVAATDARRLGVALLTDAARRSGTVSLKAYDRLFPNQDTLPRGGFGNLIALPLQQKARADGRTVFVDEDFRPYEDQWAFLVSIARMDADAVRAVAQSLSPGGSALGVRSYHSAETADATPWDTPPPPPLVRAEIMGRVPPVVRATQSNLIYVEKSGLPASLIDQIARLAAFENPEFYRAQAMRLPTYDKPRVIACAQEFDLHVGLPRGCLDDLRVVIEGYGSSLEITDEREPGVPILAHFVGSLRPEQQRAAKALLAHNEGVLSADTAFGKTVVAAELIAERGVNTLVLVHRRELMEQWRERLSAFLEMTGEIGVMGGGKWRPSGTVDIAVMQSLARRGSVDEIVGRYGHVIVDECHHVSAFSFETILRAARARYVLGLTATPVRKDGHHPIIAMQCGPVRFKTNSRRQADARPFEHVVRRRVTGFGVAALAADGIQEVYRLLVEDDGRLTQVVDDVVDAVAEGRSPLVLTERTAHRDELARRLSERLPHVFTLSSGIGVRRRSTLLEEMSAVPEGASRVLVATGRLIGEGFDDARLDTLFLAMPISWKGTLQQYAGRLHRLHDEKRDVIIYDYVDEIHPMLARMWEKRLRGYRAMGYRLEE